jgi:hypothetical protein
VGGELDDLLRFEDLGTQLRLELVDATTYPTGTALHVYRPVLCGLLTQPRSIFTR